MGVIFSPFKYSIRQNFEIFCDDILTNTAAKALPQSLYPHNNHQPIAKYRAYFGEKFHNYARIGQIFSNFIAIITRLELYGKNRGNSNSSHSSIKICIASKIWDEKLFFLDLDERVPRNFLWENSSKGPIDHQSRVRFYHLVFARYRRATIESFRKKSTNEDRCILALWNCIENSVFPIFSPFKILKNID